MPFQTVINDQQAPAVAGDFASTNPFANVLAGPGALVAPAGGLKVGNFAWVGPQGQVSQSFVAGWQLGFLGRNEQALIVEFLGEATMVVPQGMLINALYNEGDFWANFEAGATPGQNVYADPNDGQPLSGATAPALGVGTGSAGFRGTATLNGTTLLNVTAVTAGIVSPGDLVSDVTTAGNIPVGTTIVAQVTGIAGGVGTYTMSAIGVAAVGDTVATASANVFLTAIASGSFNEGDVFSGTAVSAGTTIVAQNIPFAGVASLASTTALTVTSVQPGTDLLRKGNVVVAAGVPAGTTISTQVSGTPGGVGVYTLSAAATVTQAGVAITTDESAGGKGVYQFSPAPQTFGAAAASETLTVAGTAQATGFKVRGTYGVYPGAPTAPTGLWKISSR